MFFSGVCLFLTSGLVSGVCMVSVDVTDHRQRDEALRAMDHKLRLAVDATGIGLWTWDATHGVVWDARMHEITGHETPLDQEAWWDRLVHPEDREEVAKGMRLAEEGVFAGTPHRILRPDGEVRWVLPTGRVVQDASGEVLIISKPGVPGFAVSEAADIPVLNAKYGDYHSLDYTLFYESIRKNALDRVNAFLRNYAQPDRS